MDSYAQKLAARILESSILAQAKEEIAPLAKNIINKFDTGPKPAKDMTVQVTLKLTISAKLLYEIESKVLDSLGGNGKGC